MVIMEMKSKPPTTLMSALEQSTLETMRKLHPRRAIQVLDFARWLQTQPLLDEMLEAEPTSVQLADEEAAWEIAYLANRDEFRAMAQQALQELDAGETWELTVEQGKLQIR
jgi:hypothetical protein